MNKSTQKKLTLKQKAEIKYVVKKAVKKYNKTLKKLALT